MTDDEHKQIFSSLTLEELKAKLKEAGVEFIPRAKEEPNDFSHR